MNFDVINKELLQAYLDGNDSIHYAYRIFKQNEGLGILNPELMS